MLKQTVLLAGLVSLSLAGCANQSASVYETGEVGTRVDVERAVVVHSERVEISGGENSGYGAVVGGAAGGVGALGAGGGDAIALLAAIIGAGIGYAAEEIIDSRDGIRYVLLDQVTNREFVVVQNTDTHKDPLPPGTPVLVESTATFTRVVEAPPIASDSVTGPGGSSTWVNPDDVPSEPGTTTIPGRSRALPGEGLSPDLDPIEQ